MLLRVGSRVQLFKSGDNFGLELIYKRDLEVKQRFPKGKFIVAYEPSERKEFYVMRVSEIY